MAKASIEVKDEPTVPTQQASKSNAVPLMLQHRGSEVDTNFNWSPRDTYDGSSHYGAQYGGIKATVYYLDSPVMAIMVTLSMSQPIILRMDTVIVEVTITAADHEVTYNTTVLILRSEQGSRALVYY